jgi:alpha,alpha-trehalase
LRTTLVDTGQQWDDPNGWAPLQWIAIAGLERYGETALARRIAAHWLASVTREYDASGKLLEKYNVVRRLPGGGGEYPLQDGFGWTNGVTRALIAKGFTAAH